MTTTRTGTCPNCKSTNLRWMPSIHTNKCCNCGTLSSKQGVWIGRWN